MIRTVRLMGQETRYVLKRSSRRSVGLKIDTQGLTVSIPLRMPENAIERILYEKSGWILKKLQEACARSAPVPEWRDGERFAFLGNHYALRTRMSPKVEIGINGEFLDVAMPDPQASEIAVVVEDWYKQQALDFFAERIAHFCPKLGVALPRLFLSSAKTRWGSCNSKGEVRLNWRLMFMPRHLVDYVVSHELAHLIEMNHSAAFWKKVGEIYPEHKTARAALKRSRHPVW